jgi:hypothetical protein
MKHPAALLGGWNLVAWPMNRQAFLESTVRYLRSGVDDALAVAQQIDV